MKKGSITVFLSLVLGVILSLVLTVVDSARYSAEKARIEMVLYMGLHSIFAEYNRELLSQYDLYFIDSSYGGRDASTVETAKHLKDYMDYNLRPEKGSLTGVGDLLALRLGSVDIETPSFATDSGGRVFKRQAVEAVRDKYGISAAEHIGEILSDYRSSNIKDENVENRRGEKDEKLRGIELEDDIKKVNRVYDKRDGVIERLILGSSLEISDKTLDLDNTVSHRVNEKGVGLVGADEDPDSLVNNLLFLEYLRWKFSDYTNNLGHDSASYELEYILSGKNTDRANLREAVTKLFLMREAADTIAIYQDRGKMRQAEGVAAAAAAIIALVTGTDLKEPLKNMILVTWGFAEAVLDVRGLMAGGKVPLIKKPHDWKIRTVAGIPFFMTKDGKGRKGLNYKDHLTVMLGAENGLNETTITKRAMDMIELNLRTTPGNDDLRLDGCIEYLEADVTVRDRSGREFSIRRDYSYMPVVQ